MASTPRCDEWVSQCCIGEVCAMCGQPAAAKIAEQIFADDPFPVRHELTAYVCADHFRLIMGAQGVQWVNNYRAKCLGLSPDDLEENPS